MRNVRFVGFELVSRDGTVFANEGAMFLAAKQDMISAGKVYSGGRSNYVMPMSARQQRREDKQLRRATRELLS